MTELLVQIAAPHFCAGLITHDGIAVDVAPIIKYMRGWTIRKVYGYSEGKGWTVTEVKRTEL